MTEQPQVQTNRRPLPSASAPSVSSGVAARSRESAHDGAGLGSWQVLPFLSQVLAVHAVLLPTGHGGKFLPGRLLLAAAGHASRVRGPAVVCPPVPACRWIGVLRRRAYGRRARGPAATGPDSQPGHRHPGSGPYPGRCPGPVCQRAASARSGSLWFATHGGGVGTAITQWWQGAGLLDAEVPGVADDFGTSLDAAGQVWAGTGTPTPPCTPLPASTTAPGTTWCSSEPRPPAP